MKIACLSINVLFLLGTAIDASAVTRRVGNNGVDNSGCGIEAPCRSISEAIANAAHGDIIVVGPGRYGDLNDDGNFDDPGEEDGSDGCMITVDKDVTLMSQNGAGATILDANGAEVVAVCIQSSGVDFGKPNKGFTVMGTAPDFHGVTVNDSLGGVKLTGNLATLNGVNGFFVAGGIGNSVNQNSAIANGLDGFFIGGKDNIIKDNTASANARLGFYVAGMEHSLIGNQASANGAAMASGGGMTLDGDNYVLTGNQIIGNIGVGIYVLSGSIGHLLNGNAIVGNTSYGLQFFSNSGVANIQRSNIFSNDPATNCGLRNDSDQMIAAFGNFWGADSGPGPVDPADNVCGVNSTGTDPFATKAFPIR